ncbi:sodium/proline symporter PutP [Corynebacterium sputi]|uniref:sodium/proline symporter PutP n=1 Tax=Corynebacterium sputi TaxID=489915 RepID=UPI0004029446|nr:sodium/proline symporter PutP [Corynebacterium sputi]
MSDQGYIFLALGIYLAVMILIGYLAYRKTSDHEGYMLAGRGLPPSVAALSAGASDMSGWLIMGLPGAVYAAGLIEAWIAIGLCVGAYSSWFFIAPRLRSYTEVSKNSITIPSFLQNRLRDNSRTLRLTAGVVILVFFTLYVSSGMVAGGTFYESAFDGDYVTGMLIVVLVTLVYTMFGGFLGASMTDVVQGMMIFAALVLVPIITILRVGGWDETKTIIDNADPALFSFFGDGSMTTGALIVAIVSGLAWGLGYFGQPHIIIRYMALRSPHEAGTARRIGIAWQGISMAGTVIAGLAGVAYFTEFGGAPSNSETVVLLLAQVLFHPLVAGFVLAAVLAAIMSTLSSQLIVCSSAIVEDIYRVFRKTPPDDRTLVILGRVAVFGVTVVAVLLSLNPSDTILGLVGFAWAGFGAAFGPIVFLSLFWRKLTRQGALAGMITGAVTVFIWDLLDMDLYELVPGFIVALIAAVVVSLITYKPNPEIDAEFNLAVERAKSKVALPPVDHAALAAAEAEARADIASRNA